MLRELLAEFVFRLSFGLAVAMAWTPATMVSSGFYKVHLWVLLGLNTFGALAIASGDYSNRWPLILPVVAGVASYIGAILWMYEWKKAGYAALYIVALADLVAALMVTNQGSSDLGNVMLLAQVGSSGMVLGLTMAAMLLGHWYLNSPGMRLEPLKQLIVLLLVFVVLRSLLCGGGAVSHVANSIDLGVGWYGLVALRWLSGLIGIAGLSIMTWQTLKIPNTQSATGILYVAVIFSFLGELSSQLLATSSSYPL